MADQHFTFDEIRTLNQAAAYLDGIITISRERRRELATKLFKMAGNPLPESAAVSPAPEPGER